jgi:hypothetical protein
MDTYTETVQANYTSAYYDPPSVPWWGLLSVFIFLGSMPQFLPHRQIWAIIANLLGALWCVYIGVWLRRLDSNSKALYWIVAYTFLNLPYDVVALRVSLETSWFLTWTAFVIYGLYIVGTYVVRAELEKHYNQREDFGLSLGPIMTFFFSYIYFQYHLRDIAEYRKYQREPIT